MGTYIRVCSKGLMPQPGIRFVAHLSSSYEPHLNWNLDRNLNYFSCFLKSGSVLPRLKCSF